ncbi:MAG TPA: TIGR00159 family protein [Phycisphaerales bacterium]|nr:TIGR00159 family protein [Phycisphaerales bacterium]
MNELLRSITNYIHRVSTYNLTVVAVELLLIGLVAWWVLRFLRGTRGARLVKGAAVLLALVYIVIRLLPKTGSLSWERIEFLYGKFLLFTFVAVIVAFQPELRRALIQIGQTRLFRGKHADIEALVEELVDSAMYLARNKIGSLIAVERTVGLAAIMETGTRLDAAVTSNLLNTIFYPGSALHDMGVILSRGRLAAAGCQFPLAESEDVDPSLGSRHRAALGLAQESDAVVIVVSEESGRISIACEGQLYLGLTGENLREMLLSLLAPKFGAGRKRETPTGEAP